MKYWFVFLFVITALFGCLCIGSINAGRSYVFSNNANCYSGNSIHVSCENPYSVNQLKYY